MHPEREQVRAAAAAENDCERRAPASSSDNGDFFHLHILRRQLILLTSRRSMKSKTAFRSVHQPCNIWPMLPNNHERAQRRASGNKIGRWMARRIKQIN